MRKTRARRFLVAATAVALGAVVLVTAVQLLIVPRPAALPPGASTLVLPTQPWKPWFLGGFGCPMALVTPVRVWRDGAAMVFARIDFPERIDLIWPSGYSARLVGARAELIAPDGSILARKGDVISNLAGAAADDGTILVCLDFATKPVVEASSGAEFEGSPRNRGGL